MNVLTITSLFPNLFQPDFGNFIFQRMAAFSRIHGNKEIVIAPVPYCPKFITIERYSKHRDLPAKEIRDGIDVFHPRYPLLPKVGMPLHGIFMFGGMKKMAQKLHSRHRFDLIDGHYIYPDGLAAVFIAKALKLPVVLSARGSDIHQFTQFSTIRPQIVHALRKSDHIISVCEGLKNEMASLGISPEKIDVVPNGIDASRFKVHDRLTVREELGVPGNIGLILAVGGLVPVKSHDFIIRALPMVLEKFPNVQLRIIGEGPERARLLSTAQQVGVLDWVELMGHVPNAQLQRWYNAADVFCLASSREGWANVLMESMACGTPVVATNVYGAPEIITTDKVGILVERSPEKIARGLIAALDRKWDRDVIREHVAGRTWDVVAGEVKVVFDAVLNR